MFQAFNLGSAFYSNVLTIHSIVLGAGFISRVRVEGWHLPMRCPPKNSDHSPPSKAKATIVYAPLLVKIWCLLPELPETKSQM